MASTAEQLILRGLNLVIRASFSPNDGVAQAQHFLRLQNDVGPWLKDYADEIAKPAVDWNVDFTPTGRDPDGGSGVQQ